MVLARKMTLKNNDLLRYVLLPILSVAVIWILFCIVAWYVDTYVIDGPCRHEEKSNIISFYREADVKGRIHYYVTFITKNGSVCYDTEIPPEEFYRLKAVNEPLVH